MTKAEILIVVLAAAAALVVIGRGDYEHALTMDAIHKDMPQPSPVFESKAELRRLTHPVQCDMTVNGKCYVRAESRQ